MAASTHPGYSYPTDTGFPDASTYYEENGETANGVEDEEAAETGMDIPLTMDISL